MEFETYKILWSKSARTELGRFIGFIRIDSIKNSEKVKNDILRKVATFKNNPERFTPDQFKIGNEGSVRYFEIHSIRISFKVSKGFVHIIQSGAGIQVVSLKAISAAGI